MGAKPSAALMVWFACEQQRVSIGPALATASVADDAAGAGLVSITIGLPGPPPSWRDNARDDVDRAAGRERQQQSDRPSGYCANAGAVLLRRVSGVQQSERRSSFALLLAPLPAVEIELTASRRNLAPCFSITCTPERSPTAGDHRMVMSAKPPGPNG